MASTLTTSCAERIIDLCEQGIYEPCHGSKPLDLLARGMLESATGDPETAKDLLSQAYWSLEGEWKDRAGVQLSVAYWRGGEKAEAWALLDTLPVSFDVLITQAIVEADTNPASALELLNRAQAYDVSRYKLARLHNQRGICFSLLGEPQKALEEYRAALYFAGDCPLRALIRANVGIDLEPSESHAVTDQAITELSGSHLAQVYDSKAQKLFVEGDYGRAEEYATWAVDLLGAANRRIWLFESLITRARILEAMDRPGDAINDLCRAQSVAKYLGDTALMLKATREIYRLTKSTSKTAHVRSVQLALEISTSIRDAAKKLGTSHAALRDFIRANDLSFNSRHRRSIIKKS